MLHQLNTKPNTIKSHKIQGTKLKQLQHFLLWNKANIKHSCKSQLYTYHTFQRVEDESFDSFYGKLNEVVIGKFNLGEKTEDSKIVRKILRSLPESFHAKVTTIEDSKDLDEIKVQELIGSLQTYELSLPS